MDFKRYTMTPIAVKVRESYIVLVEEESFALIKEHLVKAEKADPNRFLYYNMEQGFQPDTVSYGLGLVILDVDKLLTISPTNIDSPHHASIFNRILGFFLLPAVLREWLYIICSCFERDQWCNMMLEGELSDLWQQWGNASRFVHSGGRLPVPGFEYFNLAKARNSYFILRCFEAPPPTLESTIGSNVTSSAVPAVQDGGSGPTLESTIRSHVSSSAVPAVQEGGSGPTLESTIGSHVTSSAVPALQEGGSGPTLVYWWCGICVTADNESTIGSHVTSSAVPAVQEGGSGPTLESIIGSHVTSSAVQEGGSGPTLESTVGAHVSSSALQDSESILDNTAGAHMVERDRVVSTRVVSTRPGLGLLLGSSEEILVRSVSRRFIM